MSHVEEIFLDQSGLLTRVAHLSGGRVCDLFYESQENEAAVGDIFRGKVSRVIPSMQAAFIDLGLAHKGFLHVSDVVTSANVSDISIEKRLHEGQMLLVQISKASRLSGTSVKGPTLSAEINLSNSSLVYLPTAKKKADVVLSKKIANLESATKIRDDLLQIMNDRGLAGRLIVRSQALNSDGDISQALNELAARWATVQSAAEQKTVAGVVAREQDLIATTCHQLGTRVCKVWFGDEITQSQALTELSKVGLQEDCRIQLTDAKGVATVRELVDEAERSALDRQVALPSGGSLVFDSTEALTVVDVNTGNADMGPDTYQQTNLEAARELCLQLRLRNIGGIVVVDFINTERESDRSVLLKTLRASLDQDSMATYCQAESSLGLVEITRARKQPNVAEHFTQTCAHCSGSGRVKTAPAIGREILNKLKNQNPSVKQATVVAAPDVVDFLQKEQVKQLQIKGSSPALQLALKADADRESVNYNIALG